MLRGGGWKTSGDPGLDANSAGEWDSFLWKLQASNLVLRNKEEKLVFALNPVGRCLYNQAWISSYVQFGAGPKLSMVVAEDLEGGGPT